MEFLYSIFILPIELLYKYIYLASANITGNYGVGLFILSAISAFAFLPLSKIALASQAKENAFQDIIRPQIATINSTSSGANKNAAINRLYKRYGYHPIFGIRSAFGVLLQVPFLTGAYYMISALPEIKGQSFLFISDLSLPDGLLFGVNLLPILMTIINIGVVFTTKGLAKKDIIQALIIAFFFLILLYPAPSALLIFWTSNNLLFLMQNLLPVRKIKKTKKSTGKIYNFFFPQISAQELQTYTYLYFLSLAALMLMIFFYLPSEFYLSEPDFFNIPIREFLFSMFPYASVSALVIMLIWLWSNNSTRRIIALCAFFLLIFALVNKFIVVRDYGVLAGGHLTDANKLMEANLIFRDLLVSVFVALILFSLFQWNKIKQYRLHFLAFLTLPPLILTGMNSFKMPNVGTDKKDNIAHENTSHGLSPKEINSIHSYSKEGENIVILILDQFTGGHIEPMINDPWFQDFKKDLDGFVWYPDTLSVGSNTGSSILALHGGEEYSLDKLAKLSITPEEKASKAMYILPRNLAKYNYESILLSYYPDPKPYAAKYINSNDHPLLIDQLPINKFILSSKNIPFKLFSRETNINTTMNSFALVISLYQLAPSLIKRSIFINNWAGTKKIFAIHNMKRVARDLDLTRFFLNSTLKADHAKNTFKLLHSDLSHHPFHLKSDTVELTLNPDIVKSKHVEDYMALHYYTERHIISFIIEYVKQLKKLNIYNNTKIIIVSDHGYADSQKVKGYSIGRPHALLMVKDFNSSGDFKVDPSLMTNADTPMLALLGLPKCDEFEIKDPRGQHTRDRVHCIEPILGEKFPRLMYEVSGTMFKKENWKEYTYEEWLAKEEKKEAAH